MKDEESDDDMYSKWMIDDPNDYVEDQAEEEVEEEDEDED